ncbi:hypothetical protein NQ315_010475 [Exocentrus adspersus]|uniref:Cathepsin L n=1 Tax=Exocentrus adspersus TaxID=1586481 RepID=A0AAV8W5G4_9CUCU|nr:hypothetical protein NQ315_010475 [Exocentrus adspersus]
MECKRKITMRFLVVLASVILAINAANDVELWQEFKQKFGRDYRNLREEKVRFSTFQSNLRTIEEHNEKYNNGEVSYYMGVNQFTDLSPEEYRSMLNYSASLRPVHSEPIVWHNLSNVQAPEYVNWVEQGRVTPVKNQGNCGSCWAFSTTGAMEGAYARKTGNLVSFSEQFLMDCSTDNAGCDGGNMVVAYGYIKANGIEREDDYPYEEKNGWCRYSDGSIVTRISGYVIVPQDENSVKDAVASVGPIAAGIDAGHFQNYAGGVFETSECSSTELNHGVLIAGYGTENGKDYWLIKNSWASWWGDNGYVKMARNRNNLCGVATDPSYPVV